MSGLSSIDAIERDGFALIRKFVPENVVGELAEAMADLDAHKQRAGVRNLLKVCPRVTQFANSSSVIDQIGAFCSARPFPVHGILFDKTRETNWLVPWHQDLTIAVRDRRDVPGFGPWSIKEGIHHVQPSPEILANMITLRLHLDDCAKNNGALRVIPGSHRLGKLSAKQIEQFKEEQYERICEARAGDALLMRPMILHASSTAKAPTRRRVIHIEFASEELPGGLEWFERVTA